MLDIKRVKSSTHAKRIKNGAYEVVATISPTLKEVRTPKGTRFYVRII